MILSASRRANLRKPKLGRRFFGLRIRRLQVRLLPGTIPILQPARRLDDQAAHRHAEQENGEQGVDDPAGPDERARGTRQTREDLEQLKSRLDRIARGTGGHAARDEDGNIVIHKKH